jgi:inosose dehydratase
MAPSSTPIPLRDRIAGAPISWGVCEVPGWGHQLGPDLVLAQMREVGLAATEFGPDGFLPDAPEAKAHTLAAAGLRAVGQFVPVVLHDAARDPLPEVEAAMEGLVAAQASTVVVAAATGAEGYDERPVLDEDQWATLLHNLDRISDAAAAHDLLATLHPHVGTMVESGRETDRVLAGSHIALCLDTGHLLIGGGDPVGLAVQHPERVGHVHLKDVRRDLADRVRRGEITYTEGVARGMYVPLGAGDVDVAAIVRALEADGYQGWYVLEQDTILTGDPADTGVDPLADVRSSVAHVLAVADELAVTP